MVGTLVELAIRQHLITLAHRGGLRGGYGAGFDQAMHGLALWVQLRGGIERTQHLATGVVIEDRQAIDARQRLLFEGTHQLLHRGDHPVGHPLRSNARHGQHVEGEPTAKVVDAEGKRVVAALLTA